MAATARGRRHLPRADSGGSPSTSAALTRISRSPSSRPVYMSPTTSADSSRAAPACRPTDSWSGSECPRARIPWRCRGCPSRRSRDGGIPDPESLHHGVPPRHGITPRRIPNGILARRPAWRKEGEMHFTGAWWNGPIGARGGTNTSAPPIERLAIGTPPSWRSCAERRRGGGGPRGHLWESR